MPPQRWTCVNCGCEPAARPPLDYKPSLVRHDHNPDADYIRWNDIVATAQRDLAAIAALETLGTKAVSQYTEGGAKRPSPRARQKASRLMAAAANGVTVR